MYSNPPYYLTAYGIAVKRGFRGTEDEWLRSLTAYGLAQADGFEGTLEEWLESLTAYGLAQSAGFEGTMEEWLESLNGATFVPKVKDGVLSWENSKGLSNPEPINLYEVALGGIGRIIPVVIQPADWVEDETASGRYRFYYDICHMRITSAMTPQITLDEDSLSVAAECGMCPTAVSYPGHVRVKAVERPEQEIKATCYLSALHIPEGTGQAYELPVATEKVLGGIRGSDTIRIDADGTAHAVTACNNEVAGSGEVEQLLEDIFGADN